MCNLVSFRRKKGFSLPELLIYMALFAIVFSGVIGVMIYSLRLCRLAQTSSDLQQNALLALSKVTPELSQGYGSSIVKDTGTSNWCMIASPKTIDTKTFSFDSSGDLLWNKWVAFYVGQRSDGTKYLMKKEFVISPAKVGDPGTPPYTTLQQIKSATGTEDVVAWNVETFGISSGTSPGCYVVSVTIDKTTDSTKPNRITAQTEVSIRN